MRVLECWALRADLVVYAMVPSTIAATRLSQRTGPAAHGRNFPESVANGPVVPILCIAVRKLGGAAGLAAEAVALALLVPGGSSLAQTTGRTGRTGSTPTMTALIAQAKQLEFQINGLPVASSAKTTIS
jgi:hypothetical protein